MLANLPFGVRSHNHDRDLGGLYHQLAKSLGRHLEPEGKALLYTGATRLLGDTLGKANLKILERRHSHQGGLAVGAWLLTP